MSTQSKYITRFLDGYDILIISIVAFFILASIALWIWYGYRVNQIETQIMQIK